MYVHYIALHGMKIHYITCVDGVSAGRFFRTIQADLASLVNTLQYPFVVNVYTHSHLTSEECRLEGGGG